MTRMTRLLFAAAAAIIAAPTVHAFVHLWNNDQHLSIGEDMMVNDRDFPEGAAFHEAIEDATNFWADLTGSSYDLDHGTYNTAGLAVTIYGNLRNEIYRGSLPDGVMGRATSTAVGSHVDECDININNNPTGASGSNLNWSLIAPSPNSNRVPLKLVVVHEQGHCAGMEHNDAQANTMFSAFTIGDEGPWIGENLDAEPSEDERTWVRHIHSDASTGHNLAMTSWTIASNGAATNFNFAVDPFTANLFRRVDFVFGYLNLGTADETNVDVEYRIIPESNPIWSAGTVIDTTVIGAINTNQPFEFTKVVEFYLPADQCYHIGAFIDSSNSIAENNESNNKVISRWTLCP